MAKYIDADKLKRFVGELKERAKRNRCDSWGIVPDALEEVEGFIASLQQEQPEGLHFTPLNRLIQKIPSKNWNDTVNNYAKKLRDCLIKEGYLKDAGVLQGYISYMNGNNVPMATMDEQEQPVIQNGKFVFPKYLYARTKDNKTIDMSYAPQDMTAIEYIRNDFVEQEQPMPDSTKLIELWHEDKEMLKEKDFRDDPWRLAYNAFMCGFGRGIAVNKQEQPEVDLEKEIEEHVEGMPMSEFTHESEVEAHWDWARKEFRHFYELGRNARKEE